MRIGIGYDIHAFTQGKALILGGVSIPFEKSLKGHSDADVLLHAICDALLGAIGEGDIGELFPDTDPVNRGKSSSVFVQEVLKRVSAAGYQLVNVDTNLILENPKLSPHKAAIKESVASLLKLPLNTVSVKAKRNEGLDAIGKGGGIAAQAVVLLEKRYR